MPMKQHASHRIQISSQAPAGSASQLASNHAALKEKVLRSAYTDYYTSAERVGMREELLRMSTSHQALTGHPLP